MKRLLRCLLKLLFQFDTSGLEVLRNPGPLLLIPNHVSWMDWLLVGSVLPGHWRFVVSGVTAQTSWVHRRIMVNRRTFVIDSPAPHSARKIAEHLRSGGCLVLFAEGRISRTGSLMKIFEGVGFFLAKTDARVVFCHLRGAERLKVALNPGWRLWFPKLSLHLSALHTAPDTRGLPSRTARVRIAEWVRERMIHFQFETEMRLGAGTVPEAVEQTARLRPRFPILQDPTHTAIRYTQLIALSNQLATRMKRDADTMPPLVGLLLPNSVHHPITIMCLWCLGKTPALLNPSAGAASLGMAIRGARIRVVVSTRAFLERLPEASERLISEGVNVLFLEDFLPPVLQGWRRVSARLTELLHKPRLRLRAFEGRRETTAVILFTSGSEGAPKAVQLSHCNLLANIRQMQCVSDLHNGDRIFNALPLFHSFGLTVGTLFGLVRGCHVFLHPSPLHYRSVPDTIYDTNSTVVISTNTFLAGYARRAHPYDFRSVRMLIAAAEKVHPHTFQEWSEKFGIRILEGYGATECGPALSTNVPLASRVGSAGRFLPGIEWRLDPVEGMRDGGRLLVRGPNVMRGYLQVEPHQKIVNGWYDTGDVVRVDADGYVFLIGRLKRFAKIGGEMISLVAVEDAIVEGLRESGLENATAVLRRALPSKGECLVAVTCSTQVTRERIRHILGSRGFSPVCVPGEVRFMARMPRLGTGKIDLQHLQRLLDQNQIPLLSETIPCPPDTVFPKP